MHDRRAGYLGRGRRCLDIPPRECQTVIDALRPEREGRNNAVCRYLTVCLQLYKIPVQFIFLSFILFILRAESVRATGLVLEKLSDGFGTFIMDYS